MLLKSKATEDLIEITDPDELVNPVQASVKGRNQAGQEEQNTESYQKTDLIFPSGEPLPRCWVDADYKSAGL